MIDVAIGAFCGGADNTVDLAWRCRDLEQEMANRHPIRALTDERATPQGIALDHALKEYLVGVGTIDGVAAPGSQICSRKPQAARRHPSVGSSLYVLPDESVWEKRC